MTGPRRRAELFGMKTGRDEARERPLRVSELAALARRALEDGFDRVRVEGEVSNLFLAPSGHAYFTLKDERAQLAAVMWRDAFARLDFALEDGAAVTATGRLTIYEARGQFQMSVDRLERAGLGELERRFRELREHFLALGYFERERKRPLPHLPGVVALVTSPRGAAVRDLLTTIHRRHPRQRVVIVGVRVQGREAAAEIAAAIDRVNAVAAADVMVVGRGGGSLEDLWAFNEPAVVEAIHRSGIPVVSAVGHEVDFTLADFVADARAATPTAAAELVVPELLVLQQRLDEARCALERRVRARLGDARRRWIALAARRILRDPERILEAPRRRVQDGRRALGAALSARCALVRRTLARHELALERHAPARRLERARAGLEAARKALDAAVARRLVAARALCAARERALASLSPLAVLERGYSITRDARGRILKDPAALTPGATLDTTLARGRLTSTYTPD